MVALAGELKIAAVQEGVFKPFPAEARRWLELPRTRQVQTLVQAWQKTALFNELQHIPGLLLEKDNPNDPTLMRKSLRQFMEMVPEEEWFPVSEFLGAVKEEEPDFQRPNADYDSWYIRDEESNQYLKGFESWERVDGAMLHFTLIGVMHWLGLMDYGESAGGHQVRLTAYGRAYADIAPWPDVTDPETVITIHENGMVQAPRAMSRYNRFQLARFSDWALPGDIYEYTISTASLARAAEQGIKAEHIRLFLRRTSGNQVPQSVEQMLDKWEQGGAAAAVITRRVLLETDAESTADTIYNTPELRRFLGARLGARVIAVQEDQWQVLMAALKSHGILAEQEIE
jgi:hypothetical protein